MSVCMQLVQQEIIFSADYDTSTYFFNLDCTCKIYYSILRISFLETTMPGIQNTANAKQKKTSISKLQCIFFD